MKKFLSLLLQQLYHFIDHASSSTEKEETPLQQHREVIELALYKKAAVHVIYGHKSFTGDIIRYDAGRQRLVLKNFPKNMSSIIFLKDIRRISLVPDSVRSSQLRS